MVSGYDWIVCYFIASTIKLYHFFNLNNYYFSLLQISTYTSCHRSIYVLLVVLKKIPHSDVTRLFNRPYERNKNKALF